MGFGDYVFRLSVTNNRGIVASDDVKVHVNYPPRADAGFDQVVALPHSSALLNGSGFDRDGSIQSYSWRQMKGPLNALIEDPSQPTAEVRGLSIGTYTFRLTVTDDMGDVGFSDTQVSVR